MVMNTSTLGLPPKGGWRVSSQLEEKKRTVSGQYVDGVTVHFLTGNGVSSSVWVPNATYTPANVKKAISSKVAVLDAVSNLSTSPKGA